MLPENGSTANVTVDYEFTHRVMKGSSVLIPKKVKDTATAYRKNHPNKKKPRSSYDTEYYRVPVSHLDGSGFKIDAYTRLTLIQQGSNIVDRTFRITVDDITFP